MTDQPILPTLGVNTDGRLTITVADHTTTIEPNPMNNSRAWLVIHPTRGFLRGFDNPDRANAYAQEHRAVLVAARVEADHRGTGR